MSTKRIVTAIVAAAVAAGAFALPTAASAGDRGGHRDRWEHRYDRGHGNHGYWKHKHHKHHRHYYRPGYVVAPYAPPVVVYPAAPAYPVYPAYPAGNGSFSITYQGWF